MISHAPARSRARVSPLLTGLFALTWFATPALAAGGSSGVWTAPEMPGWALPAAFGILVGVYVLIVFEIVHRALAASLGAIAAVVALHIVGGGPDLGTLVTWIDEETIGLLIGMMVIVAVLSDTGLFEWAAVKAYAMSGGSIWKLTILLCAFTAVFSAFLDNVTTILLIVPVTIQIAKVLDLEPVPLIIAEVMFSNIGGAATQIGDPPNIIIGAQLSAQALKDTPLAGQEIAFIDFIIHVAPAVAIASIPSLWLLRKIEKDGLSGRRERSVELLSVRYGIKDVELLNKSLVILSLVIIAFFAHSSFHHPLLSVATIAIGGAVLMLLVSSPHRVEEKLDAVEWTTIIFFAGLFIMIHGLEYMGLIDSIAQGLADAVKVAPPEHRLLVAVVLLLWVSAIASAFIDNIPYTATMVPVIIDLAQNESLGLDLGPLAWALALGACLGGNGTIIGASANVVAAGLAEEAGTEISFNRFFKTGFPMMLFSIVIATVYSVARYAVEWDSMLIPAIIIIISIIANVLLWRVVSQEEVFEADPTLARAEIDQMD